MEEEEEEEVVVIEVETVEAVDMCCSTTHK